jgi:hypothetical protein
MISSTYTSAGFLFFGTITGVEEAIRKLVELAEWQRNPIRFLIIDLSLVVGVDMSSAEAFVRVQRILAARSVTMVFSGFTVDSAVGIALQSVGLLEADYVEVFTAFTDAVECKLPLYSFPFCVRSIMSVQGRRMRIFEHGSIHKRLRWIQQPKRIMVGLFTSNLPVLLMYW